MHRLQALMVLGLMTALSPFIGLPYAWLMWILPLGGLSVFALAVMLELKRRSAQTRIEKVRPDVTEYHDAPSSF